MHSTSSQAVAASRSIQPDHTRLPAELLSLILKMAREGQDHGDRYRTGRMFESVCRSWYLAADSWSVVDLEGQLDEDEQLRRHLNSQPQVAQRVKTFRFHCFLARHHSKHMVALLSVLTELENVTLGGWWGDIPWPHTREVLRPVCDALSCLKQLRQFSIKHYGGDQLGQEIVPVFSTFVSATFIPLLNVEWLPRLTPALALQLPQQLGLRQPVHSAGQQRREDCRMDHATLVSLDECSELPALTDLSTDAAEPAARWRRSTSHSHTRHLSPTPFSSNTSQLPLALTHSYCRLVF